MFGAACGATVSPATLSGAVGGAVSLPGVGAMRGRNTGDAGSPLGRVVATPVDAPDNLFNGYERCRVLFK